MRDEKGLSPDAGRGADAGVKGLRKNFMNMNQIYRALFIICLSFSRCLAGDLVDSSGAYDGSAYRTSYSTSTGAYGGSIFRNGNISDASGGYAGYITRNGSIVDSKGGYGGFIAKWRDVDVE